MKENCVKFCLANRLRFSFAFIPSSIIVCSLSLSSSFTATLSSMSIVFSSLVLLMMLHQIHGHRLIGPSPITNCTFKHADQVLHEGDRVTIEQKIYIVEDCHLQRAYQTCGAHLWFMINIVCQAIEQHKGKTHHRLRRFSQPKLLTDACCENVCTVNEMTRYCP